MSNLLPISLAIIPLAPLMAGVLVLIATARGAHGRWFRLPGMVGCALSCMASSVLLWELQHNSSEESFALEWGSWLNIAGPFPIEVSLGVRIDQLSALVIAAVTLMGFAASVACAATSDERSHSRWSPLVSPLVVFGGIMLLLAPNVLQFFFFWEWTALLIFAAAADQQENAHSSAAARKAFLISRVGDAPLLFGLFLFWYHFGSPNWLEVLSTNLTAEGEPEKGHALGAVGICLMGGVVARCAQFPLLGWLEDFAASARREVLLWEVIFLMPTGIYLVARFAGAIVDSESLQLTVLAVGGFTAFLAALSAGTAVDARRTIAFSAASLCGWMLMGFATADPGGIEGAMRLLLVSIVGLGVLVAGVDHFDFGITSTATVDRSQPSAAIQTTSRKGLASWWPALGSLLLTSGCWGQSAILTSIWECAGSIGPWKSLALVDMERKVLLLALLGLGSLSLLLLAFGLFRSLFLLSYDAGNAEEQVESPKRRGTLVLGIVLIFAAVIFSPIPFRGWEGFEGLLLHLWPMFGEAPKQDLFSIGFGLAPALLGLVSAWMSFGSGVHLSTAEAGWLRPLVRWSRSRYFLDDFFFLFLELPIRGLAQFCRFVDWFLIDGLLVQIPARIPAEVAKAARPLQQVSAQLAAVGVLLATAVLLTVLLWGRG